LNSRTLEISNPLFKPWQLQVFESSLKKKEKVHTILDFIENTEHKRCLEIGCEKGITGYFLRKTGGFWVSTDIDRKNVFVTKELIKENIVYFKEDAFPFSTGSFDLIIAIDTMEHIEDDEAFLRDLHRILKKDGTLYISVPSSYRSLILNKIAQKAGITLEHYGHKREGYSVENLEDMLARSKFQMTKFSFFSRFFTEGIELLINFGYMFFLNKGEKSKGIKGGISPSSEEDFKRHSSSFALYQKIYPILRAVSRIDIFLSFTRGYAFVLEAKKQLRGNG